MKTDGKDKFPCNKNYLALVVQVLLINYILLHNNQYRKYQVPFNEYSNYFFTLIPNLHIIDGVQITNPWNH